MRSARRWSIGLQAATSIGVVVGFGGFLSGSYDALVADIEQSLPFVTSGVVPALALVLVVGVQQVAALVAALRRGDRAPVLAALAGAVLAAWIAGQVLVIGWSSPLQPVFFAVGVSETVVGAAWVRGARAARMGA